MKRIIYILAALVIAACTEAEPLATVRISIGGVQTGALTKTLADGVEAAIEATRPSDDITLTLTSTSVSTRVFTAKPGQSVTIPVGEYKVAGKYTPQVVGDATGNNIYKTPAYSVDDRITITEGGGDYSVRASYDCFALVIDYSTTAAYRHSQYQQMTDFAFFTTVGDIGIAYIGLDYLWGSINYRLVAVPKDYTGHEDTEYRLVAQDGFPGVKIEKGKWYSFAAGEVTTASGNIRIEWPQWVEGN